MKTLLKIAVIIGLFALLLVGISNLPEKNDNFSEPVTTPGWGKK